jgi:hypothetical protein
MGRRRVLRYEVSAEPASQVVTMPFYSQILACAAKGGFSDPVRVEFWAECDEGREAELAPRIFRVFGTGHDLPEDALWRGTCPRLPDGRVAHLYELEIP